MNSKLQKLDEECKSLSSECTTKEVMLNCIHGFPKTDTNTDTQNFASDVESHNQDYDLDIPERMINGSKDACYVTSSEQDDTSHGNTDNGDCAILQQDATTKPSYIYENGIHENLAINVQSIDLTPQNKSTSSHVKIVPDLQTYIVKTQDNNFTDTSQEIMKVAYPITSAIPSTSSYIHYTAAIDPSNTEIEGDYIDYHISVDQQPTLPNFQNTDHSVLHIPLQDSKNESSNNSNDKVNTISPAQDIYVDSEMIVSTNYLVDSEMEGGQYIDYDSAVQQIIDQNGMNANTNM